MSLIRQVVLEQIQGTISIKNSTSSPIGGGSIFTGDWEEITDYAIIKIAITSNVASASDGFCIQQSTDQVELWEDTYTLAADSHKLYTINPVAKYFRIVYTNGAAAQSTFIIQTIFSSVYTKPTSPPRS